MFHSLLIGFLEPAQESQQQKTHVKKRQQKLSTLQASRWYYIISIKLSVRRYFAYTLHVDAKNELHTTEVTTIFEPLNLQQ